MLLRIAGIHKQHVALSLNTIIRILTTNKGPNFIKVISKTSSVVYLRYCPIIAWKTGRKKGGTCILTEYLPLSTITAAPTCSIREEEL
jgi:hypothetical protein